MDYTLFSQTKINELCSGEKLSRKQKKAIIEWKQNLDEGKFQIERKSEDFFRDLMLDALGYERKDILKEENRLDYSYIPPSGKGGILFELKSRKKKLDKDQGYKKDEQRTPVRQAITYLEENSNIDYAVVSNFQEFVLITREDLNTQCYKFEFPPKGMKLLETEMIEFASIFSKKSIDNKFIKKIRDETIIEEDVLTNDFYQLFHQTRLMLIKAFQEKSNVGNHEAIKIAQRYLNRLIFIFFAEDNGLIKKDIFSEGLLNLLDTGDMKEGTTKISDFIQTIFSWMNKGSFEIEHKIGFKGELFQESINRNAFFYDFRKQEDFEEIIKKTKLSKNVKLNKKYQKSINRYKGKINPIISNLLIMDRYNFGEGSATGEYISVNILGHIFEQSIGDLEKLRSEEISKQKKDGIFYTPDYITSLICSNTIIPYLSKNGSTSPKQLVKEYVNDITELEKKLEQIKILDPACGSGAFLVKAVDVLLAIYHEIQNFKEEHGSYTILKKGKKSGTATVMTLDKHTEMEKIREIIQNNIFGVDLNSESLEITQLSLFLKIASKNKKLLELSKTIKTGNSLNTFEWEKDFKNIFKDKNSRGFDIIIGNPPYVVLDQKALMDYNLVKGNHNTYVAFVEKSIELLKNNGKIGFIIPTTWLSGNNFEEFRKELLFNLSINLLIQLPYDIFEAYIDTVIIGLDKSKISLNNVKTFKYNIRDKAKIKPIDHYVLMDSSKWEKNPNYNITLEPALESIYKKYLNHDSVELGIISKIQRGTLPPKKDNIFTTKKGKNFIEWYDGQVSRYLVKEGNRIFVEYDRLLENKPIEVFESKKIMARQLVTRQFRIQFAKFDKICAFKKNLYAIYDIDKEYDTDFLIAILNSKLFSFVHVKANVSVQRDDFPSFTLKDFRKFLIPHVDSNVKQELAKNAKNITIHRLTFNLKLEKIHNRLKTVLKIEKIGEKLEKLNLLTFDEFMKEVSTRSLEKISLKEQDEWEDYFNEYKNDLCSLDEKINLIEQEIDQIVYKIYNLTENEMGIIKNTLKI